MATLFPYTEPELKDAGGDVTKVWFIEYYFRDPGCGKLKRQRLTFNINRLTTVKERREWGIEAIRFLKEQLDAGFNPIEAKRLKQTGKKAGFDHVEKITVLNTINKSKELMIGAATSNAADTYRTMYNRFRRFMEESKYHELTFDEFNNEIVYEFQDYMKIDLKLSRKSINSTVSHIGLFWDQKLVRKLSGTNNPFRGITSLKAKDFRGIQKDPDAINKDFVPLTADEMDSVIKYYNSINATDFLRLLGMIFYAFVRPVEISRLRVQDFDLNNRAIRFLRENTKDDEYAHVQIVDELYELLLPLDLNNLPRKHFVFSRDLRPGEKQADAWWDYTEEWWNSHVVRHLGIDRRMYAVKHTGNIEYLLRNKGKVDMKWLQMQNRHSSTATTEKYIKKLGVYFIDTEQLRLRSFM